MTDTLAHRIADALAVRPGYPHRARTRRRRTGWTVTKVTTICLLVVLSVTALLTTALPGV